jgi:hypothetical protein
MDYNEKRSFVDAHISFSSDRSLLAMDAQLRLQLSENHLPYASLTTKGTIAVSV